MSECVCEVEKFKKRREYAAKQKKCVFFIVFFLLFSLFPFLVGSKTTSSQHHDASFTTYLYSCILILTHLLKLLTHSLAFLLTCILHVYSSSGQGVVVHRRKGHSNPTNDSFLISIIMSYIRPN